MLSHGAILIITDLFLGRNEAKVLIDTWLICVFSFIALVLVCCIAITLYCFFKVFYSPKRKPLLPDEYSFPVGEIYDKYHDQMVRWTKQVRELPHVDMEIKSFDGLTLKGKYYEYKPGAVIEILFHGYKGDSERDMCGAVERCFLMGRNALLVDQRAAGRSDGHVISFGINERLDCVSWAKYVAEKFGEDQKIVITGISMGASTVLMAAADPELPKNVISVLADCGYSSAELIIKKVIAELHLSPRIFYPFVRLAGLIFGGFDLNSFSPIEAIEKINIPIVFVHGTNDDFVPFEMSKSMFDKFSGQKILIAIDGAGHGLAYPANKEEYLSQVKTFIKQNNLA